MLVQEGVVEGPLKKSSIDIQDRSRHSVKVFFADTKHAIGLKISFLNTILFLLFHIYSIGGMKSSALLCVYLDLIQSIGADHTNYFQDQKTHPKANHAVQRLLKPLCL